MPVGLAGLNVWKIALVRCYKLAVLSYLSYFQTNLILLFYSTKLKREEKKEKVFGKKLAL
ncbi:MAG TPA: hypothetical protein DEH02_16505 [Bacteroidales bacterium]|nr:MAG: hypothetical protein A2X01_09060 [Bacteroidetes bacterium GWF2_35_48]HBX52667.1 hypothetical protein [Bacteroidales bacterium]